METKVIFTVQGQKTLVAGKAPIKIRAYDPRLNGDDGGIFGTQLFYMISLGVEIPALEIRGLAFGKTKQSVVTV